uniref:Uncharacterized protein n=1 Tax=Loa loa TaxID=7209 RepID=A0A1I7VJX4_LOALO
MSSEADISSLESSIELKDTLIDTKWFQPDEIHSLLPTGNRWSKRTKKAKINKLQDSHRPFYIRWYDAYKIRALNQRLEQYNINEIQSFIEQKIRKINDIITEEEIKLRLISSVVLKPDHIKSDPDYLTRKYGTNLIRWLDDVAAKLNRPSKEIIEELMIDFTYLKEVFYS